MDQRVAVSVGHGFHSFLQFHTIGQMLARCSAPYSGPKAAQVFVGPMAGCAGGQSARAGGSWLLLLQLARSSAVQRHIIALEAELEPGL